MPYRRLPNTDSSRLRALKLAIQKGENLSPREKPYSQSSLQNISNILPQFERLIKLQKEAYKAQTEKSPEYNYLYKKARNYVSHFIQVLNLAIIRGDLKKEARDFFKLNKDEKKLPIFKTEQDIIEWGELVIEAEPRRIENGGNPMTNPTIGIVKVHYEKFLDAYRKQKNLQDNYSRTSKKVAEFRPEVDKVILQLWNEIEASFDPNSEVIKRNLCREYGLVYFFRRNEIIPPKENVSDEYRKNRVVNKDLRKRSEIEEKNDELDVNQTEEDFGEEINEVDGTEVIETTANEELVNEEMPGEEELKDEAEEDDESNNFQYSLF